MVPGAVLLDAAVVLLFAALGRNVHRDQQGGLLAGTLVVAAPFLICWFGAAAVSRFYRADILMRPSSIVLRLLPTWLAACTVALALRSVWEGHLMPVGFAFVSFGFVFALLSVVHALLIVLWLARRSA